MTIRIETPEYTLVHDDDGWSMLPRGPQWWPQHPSAPGPTWIELPIPPDAPAVVAHASAEQCLERI
jgi:hypothetical protein